VKRGGGGGGGGGGWGGGGGGGGGGGRFLRSATEGKLNYHAFRDGDVYFCHEYK